MGFNGPPNPQAEHLHLVLQVETKILRRTNSRKRHSREGRRKEEETQYRKAFLPHSSEWHSRQG